MLTPQFNLKRHRKNRQNRSMFSALLSAPAGAEVTLPASGRFAVRSISGCAAGTLAATLTGPADREIATPELAAGGRVVIDWIERATEVALESDFELYIDVGMGRWAMIAENP
jgi:hypothetical protein